MATVEKVSVSLPKDLVEEIKNNIPEGQFSRFVGEAVRFYRAMRRQKEAIESGFGDWRTDAHPELATAEDTRRYVRDLRERDRPVDSTVRGKRHGGG